MPEERCWVQVLCIQDDFLAVDFGHFAMIIASEPPFRRARPLIGQDYYDLFQEFLNDLDFSICIEEDCNISPEDFHEAERIALRSQHTEVNIDTKQFLKRVFSEYFALIVS